jgi:hypothetical protein
MISRRNLLKWSAVAPAIIPDLRAQIRTLPSGVDAMVLDSRFTQPGLAERFDRRVHLFSGDVTDLWFEVLDPRWRRPGFVLGGITGEDALFVLERLAWDRGRRVTARRELPAQGPGGRPVVNWIIAPVHPSVRA